MDHQNTFASSGYQTRSWIGISAFLHDATAPGADRNEVPRTVLFDVQLNSLGSTIVQSRDLLRCGAQVDERHVHQLRHYDVQHSLDRLHSRLELDLLLNVGSQAKHDIRDGQPEDIRVLRLPNAQTELSSGRGQTCCGLRNT